jgi:hypothetical protein
MWNNKLCKLLMLVPAFSFYPRFSNNATAKLSGRWSITSSNRLEHELEGTMTVEIENHPNKFRAIGYRDRKLFASQTSRQGTFKVLRDEETFLLGELEFLTDDYLTTSVVGIGLPEPISTKSESLGNRKRRVQIHEITLNRVVVLFVESNTFYVLERRMDLAKEDNVLYDVLTTQIITVMTSILFEIFRHGVIDILSKK